MDQETPINLGTDAEEIDTDAPISTRVKIYRNPPYKRKRKKRPTKRLATIKEKSEATLIRNFIGARKNRYILAVWHCDSGHKFRTRIEGGILYAPVCPKCNDGDHCKMATLDDTVHPSDYLAIFGGHAVAACKSSLMFGHLTKILDMISAKSAAGNLTTKWCKHCADFEHMQKCNCVCHEAFAYRQAVLDAPEDVR